jgi:hypothetical protein
MIHKFSEIVQDDLPVKPWREAATRRLPGVQPLDLVDWVWVDEAFPKQMAYREYLLVNRSMEVLQACASSEDAVAELLEVLLEHLTTIDGYEIRRDTVLRPDGGIVALDKWSMMETIGRLVQQDFCILNKVGSEHVLQAAVLCFPASWSLAEKIGKPLIAIHEPVDQYDGVQAKKVQKMFDLMRSEQALWRANRLVYSDPDLFQPRRESNRRGLVGDRRWARVERQTLRKLPKTDAIVFGIHTSVVRFETLNQKDQLALG